MSILTLPKTDKFMIDQRPTFSATVFKVFTTLLARFLFKKVKYAALPYPQEVADFLQAAVLMKHEYSYRIFSTWRRSTLFLKDGSL